ncbi:MAG: MerR family transcriptional regulator [Steroidobacteraceae bacterium]|uniref:Transcriptional regulator merD n=1 Tax=mine drainage metagenome TaxID=410659 RepID=T0YD88_9ZZZZ
MTAVCTTGSARHTIAQIARLAGVSVSRARRYATLEVIRPCAVTTRGYQLFDDVTVQRIHFLTTATHAGMSLADVAKLLTSIDQGDAQQVEAVRGRLHHLVEDRHTTLTRFSMLLEHLCTDGGRPVGQAGVS